MLGRPLTRVSRRIVGRFGTVTQTTPIARVVAGHAPPGPMHLFALDVSELAVVRLPDPPEHLIIESWVQGRGLKRVERE